MNTKNYFFTIFILVFLISCGPSKNDSIQGISEKEDALFNEKGGMTSLDKANELVVMYIEFADQYPEDSMAAEYIFKGADISMNINQPQQAIDLYDRIINDYPDFRKAPECLFLKGYVYENYFNDLDQARAIYTEFIEKYPENDFADDAQISINNLGKSPEELIQEFEEKMKAQQDGQE